MSTKQSSVIPLREQAPMPVENARVISVAEKEVAIRLTGATQTARVAFSCLIKPELGDLVLCTKSETGANFILGIIERPGEQNMTLAFPADATILAENGNLSALSQKSVTLAAADKLNCFSDQVIHKSRDAVVDYDEVVARGTTLQATFSTVRLISQMVNILAKQVIDKFKNYIRHTEDYDQVKAGQMTRKADGLYSVDSKNTVLVSKKDTKIDGERIHMG